MSKLRAAAVSIVVMGLALFGVPSVASANPCFLPGNCSRDTQLIAVTGSGGLFHTFRNGTDGGWTPMGSVPGQAGNPGQVVDTSAAIYYGDLHVVAATSAGGLHYTMRGYNASWSQFVDVKAAAGNPGAVTDAAIAVYHGNVHAFVRTSTGGLYYAARAGSGEWSQFTDLRAQIGDPGSVVDVAAVGIGDFLHILVTNNSGRLYHAIRHADGSWTPIGNVKQVTGNPGTVHDVAAGAAWGVDGAGIDGQIQIAVAAGNGGLYHAVRYANGTWTSLGSVKQVTGDPGPVTRVGFSG